jgi:hypothetical protein
VWDRKDYAPATVNPRTAPLVPLDGTVIPAVPGHLSAPLYAAAAPARAVAAPTRPALEEPHGQDW